MDDATESKVAISVIIPAFNAGDVIGNQLQSLSEQRWTGDWEVIIADNGSTDGTTMRAKAWQGKVPRLRVVDASDKQGASHARNVGARNARGTYLLFLDADDVTEPGWLVAMAAASRDSALIAGVTVPHLIGGGDAEAGIGRATAFSKLLPSEGFLDAAGAGNLGVRRDVWDSVGGFRESMMAGEDTAFCWDVQLAGYSLLWVPEAVVRYHVRRNMRQLAKQQYAWGVGAAQLYGLFKDSGAPRPSFTGAMVRWLALIATTPVVVLPGPRRRIWVGRISRRAGRLIGSIRHRVLSL